MPQITPFLWFDDQADPAASRRVMQSLLKMGKIDIQALREAYAERSA